MNTRIIQLFSIVCTIIYKYKIYSVRSSKSILKKSITLSSFLSALAATLLPGLAKADFAEWTDANSGSVGDSTFSISGLNSPSLTPSDSWLSVTEDSTNYNPAPATGKQWLAYSVNDNFTVSFSKPTSVYMYLIYFRSNYTYVFSQAPTIVSGLSGWSLTGSSLSGNSWGKGILSFSNINNLTVSSDAFGTLDYSAQIFDFYIPVTTFLPDTQTSLTNNLASLQGAFNLQTSIINNGLSYDCSLFDTRGLCISTGGRYSNTNTPTGDSTGALVIGSYRVNDNVRVGAYLDQGISSSMPTGIHLQQHNPLFGAFGVWQASEDGLGAQVKVAAGYNDADMTVTRTVIGTSEAGSGSTNLTTKAISVVGSYGVEMQGSWIASPYAGARYTNVKADGYTEATDSAVTAPLTYANLEQSAVSLLAGIRWYGKLTDRVALNGSVGVEHDVDNSHANYTATGIAGLTPTVFNTAINKTRAVASGGTTVSIDKRQQLAFSVMYREEAFSHSSTTSAYGTYTIGF